MKGALSLLPADRVLAGAGRRTMIFATVWLFCAGSGGAKGQEPASPAPIDFARDIRPLLKQHCYACHGPVAQSAGLRLDVQDEAAAGGISGRPVIGGTRETNELFRRVSADDPIERMPKNAAPLTPEEIERIGRWVDEQTPWVDPPPADPETLKPPPPRTWRERLAAQFVQHGSWIDGTLWFVQYLGRWMYVILAVHILLLVVIRCRRMQAAGHPSSTRRARRWFDLCAALRPSHYLIGLLTFALWITFDLSRFQVAQSRRQVKELTESQLQLQQKLSAATDPVTLTKNAYGDPPIPIRPTLPPRLGGEYYRGNCERNPELFNRGNYRTATLRLTLCDSQRRPLESRDAVPPGGLLVKFEIVRAPHTAESLFTEEYLSGVFLSRQFYQEAKLQPVTESLTRMEVVEPAEHWAAYFPLGDPPVGGEGTLSGLIYVYWGMLREKVVRGTPHYGIQYDLKFADGKIAAESDLWLGSLFWTPALAYPQRDKVPLDEWFDHRPIPEIVGGNTSDPKLLGIPEHERKLEEKRRFEEENQ